MPNDVYRAAVDGLTALVPPRAAQRLVDDSLRATRRTSDDVSVAAMRRLLLGPIRDELAGVLPPSAIGPGLKRIAAELHGEVPRKRRWWRFGRERNEDGERHVGDAAEDLGDRAERERTGAPVPALAAAAKAVATSGPATSVRSTDAAWTQPAHQLDDEATTPLDSAAPAAVGAATPGGHDAATSRGRGGAVTSPTRRRPAALPRLDTDLIARALKVFGELETVRQVVAVAKGELVDAGGEGLDPQELPGLVKATSGLLSRAGRLHVFALERPSGAVFLFPLTGGELVVLTRPNVNFGAVLAARAALEEAA